MENTKKVLMDITAFVYGWCKAQEATTKVAIDKDFWKYPRVFFEVNQKDQLVLTVEIGTAENATQEFVDSMFAMKDAISDYRDGIGEDFMVTVEFK